MNESTLWWVIAGVLVAVELATGTFYLLMLALGAAAGAMAAHAGFGESLQLAAAGVVGGCCAGAWYLRRRRLISREAANPLGAQMDPDLSLDLGQTVQVTAWQDDGTAQVQYRGAPWQARLHQPPPAPAPLPQPGIYRICAMRGNQLLLEKA
ncbi:MAG: NfeD family protein [Aquabacterium sp.]